jgi:hypothetical protein
LLFKNIIAQIRYHYNENYKNDLILNLGVKKIARHSKIIFNLYKTTKNNETTTEKNQCEKKTTKTKDEKYRIHKNWEKLIFPQCLSNN